ncbi:RNA polymerase II-associated protein 3-like isoform X2 [Mucor ambiguus]|uniref:RNA polymerase II-associated protein 3 n=1 Tax=Mucor ambiguus TaxID=91626 RepID=A0A0C9N6F2_9FUNG|nr:RNA polymerase II-associated protein 3-like isoform X2 [Mucor ambiguus]
MATEAAWKDLLNWQTDIHRKDEALLRRKPIHDQALPPVRKSTEILLDNAKPVGIDALSNTSKASATSLSRAEKAEAEKAKGNEYFGKKDYKNAILHYGKAIDLDPTVPVYFVNRAMAHLKTNSFLEAEKDCSRGLQLQPKNVKALWRRGIALRELGRMNEARKDFETGLTIEPCNKSLLDELKKLPAAKPVEKSRSKKPDPVEQKRRLPINVIDGAYTKSKIVEQPASQKKKPTSATPTPIAKKVDPPKKPASAPEPAQKMDTTAKKAATLPVQTTTATTKLPPQPLPVPLNFTCPRTNFEFERDWKTYKGRGDDVLYQYFQVIPPRDYPAIFKSSLESDQFEKMLDFVDARYTKEKTPTEVYNVLWGLSRVQRIDMLIMFLDKKHQQVIQRVFDLLKSRPDEIPHEVLAKLFKIYGIQH